MSAFCVGIRKGEPWLTYCVLAICHNAKTAPLMPNIPQKITLEGILLILWEICCQNPKGGGFGALKELRLPEVQPR